MALTLPRLGKGSTWLPIRNLELRLRSTTFAIISVSAQRHSLNLGALNVKFSAPPSVLHFYALDIRTQATQLLFYFLVTTVDMVNTLHFCASICHQPGNNQRRRRA